MVTTTIEQIMLELERQKTEYKNIARKISEYERFTGRAFTKVGGTKMIPLNDAEIFKRACVKMETRQCRTYAEAFEVAQNETGLQRFQQQPTTLLGGVLACEATLTHLNGHVARLKPERGDFDEVEMKIAALRAKLTSTLDVLNEPSAKNYGLTNLTEEGTQTILDFFVALAQLVPQVLRLDDLLRVQLEAWQPRDDRAYASLRSYVLATRAQVEEASGPGALPEPGTVQECSAEQLPSLNPELPVAEDVLGGDQADELPEVVEEDSTQIWMPEVENDSESGLKMLEEISSESEEDEREG